MSSVRKAAVLIVALACAPLTSFAQGGGAGAGGASSGSASSGSASSGSASSGIGPVSGSTPSPNGDANGQPATSDAKRDRSTVVVTDPSSGGAPTARGRGVGTAPNGLPIGSPGSGPGSPERPHDSATVQIQRR